MYTDGVPHASMWLNDTVNGTEGTFVPLTNAAVNVDHMYVLAAFRARENPQGKPSKSSSNGGKPGSSSTHVRLYRIDIRSTIAERLKIRWHYDFLLNGTIPYLGSNATRCTSTQELLDHPTGIRQSKASRLKSERCASIQDRTTKNGAAFVEEDIDAKVPVSSIIAEGAVIIASVNFITSPSSVDMQSLLIGIDDMVFSYSVNYMGYSPELVASLGWFDPLVPGKGKGGVEFHTKTEHTSQQKRATVPGETFWISKLSVLKKSSYLEERELWFAGKVMRRISLDTVLHKQGLVATTELSVLQTRQSGSTGSAELETFHSAGSKAVETSSATTVLILGLHTDNPEASSSDPPHLTDTAEHLSYIVALNISNADVELLWKLPLPSSATAAVGQIATVDTARDSQMVITTPLAVYVYSLNTS